MVSRFAYFLILHVKEKGGMSAWSASLKICPLRPRLCTQHDVAHIPEGRFTDRMIIMVWVRGENPAAFNKDKDRDKDKRQKTKDRRQNAKYTNTQILIQNTNTHNHDHAGLGAGRGSRCFIQRLPSIFCKNGCIVIIFIIIRIINIIIINCLDH